MMDDGAEPCPPFPQILYYEIQPRASLRWGVDCIVCTDQWERETRFTVRTEDTESSEAYEEQQESWTSAMLAFLTFVDQARVDLVLERFVDTEGFGVEPGANIIYILTTNANLGGKFAHTVQRILKDAGKQRSASRLTLRPLLQHDRFLLARSIVARRVLNFAVAGIPTEKRMSTACLLLAFVVAWSAASDDCCPDIEPGPVNDCTASDSMTKPRSVCWQTYLCNCALCRRESDVNTTRANETYCIVHPQSFEAHNVSGWLCEAWDGMTEEQCKEDKRHSAAIFIAIMLSLFCLMVVCVFTCVFWDECRKCGTREERTPFASRA